MRPKHSYRLAEGEPLSAGCKKNECRNERYPVGVESESHGRAEIRGENAVMQIVRENRRKKPPQTERFRPGRELAATMEIETAEDPEVIDAEVLKAFVESRPSSATRYAPSGASLVSAVSAAPSIARGMGTMRRF